MNKFRQENRSYFQTGVSGYIGSGNNPSVYSKRGMPSFSRLRQIYGDHLENYKSQAISITEHKELPIEIKNQIRNRYRKEHKKNIRNRVIALIISLVIFIGLAFSIYKISVYIIGKYG